MMMPFSVTELTIDFSACVNGNLVVRDCSDSGGAVELLPAGTNRITNKNI